jgi:translation initiation factor IF-3
VKAVNNTKLRTNERIRSHQVRLIDDKGQNIGVITTDAALERAKDAGLDLVEVAPEAKPPVCKIMDYSRYHYEQKKKLKENRKKSKVVQLKQIRLSPNIGKHDLKIKFNQIRGFLEGGHKVKVNMRFRGRQAQHKEVGIAIMESIIEELKDIASCQSPPKLEGYFMTMLLVPNTIKTGEQK